MAAHAVYQPLVPAWRLQQGQQQWQLTKDMAAVVPVHASARGAHNTVIMHAHIALVVITAPRP
eukprot:2812175-Amphidinium_carterae.1